MKNISTLKERIIQFIEYKGISKNKFYVDTGIANGTLDKKSGLTMDTVEKFYSTYSNVNPEWILIGKEPMIKPDQNPMPVKLIPVIPIDAMAGYGNGEQVVMEHDITDGYVVPEWNDKGVKYMIRVSGSSMYPKYSNGDLLGCKPVKDVSFFQWGKIYVLDTDQGPLVKRLYPEKDNQEILWCHSDNKEKYPPFPIAKTSIYRVAIVVGVIRFE